MTSSPTHPKSNRKSESAVKVAKKIFKKAYKDDKDPWLALLDQHNTPTQGVNSSPAQQLMSLRTRTLLPVSANLLYPRVEEVVQEKLKTKRQKAKSYYDRGAKVLPDLEVGQEVRVAGQRKKTWEPATCIQKLSDRSYMVEVNRERVRRNREALKSKYDTGSLTQNQLKPVKTGGQAAMNNTHHENVSHPQQRNPSVPLKTTRTRAVRAPARFKDYV